MAVPYLCIDTQEQLSSLINHWLKLDAIALDTEFERSTTYFPILSLIQIYDGTAAYLIDALDEKLQISELQQILTSKQLIKVIHSGEEDITALYHKFHIAPEYIFDSQLAADMVGLGSDLAYIKLVNQLEQISLAKSETRTNWLQRPLTTAQLNYAAEDVIYLLPIYRKLNEILKQQDRSEWLWEESENKRQKAIKHYHEDGSKYFYKITGAGKFNLTQQQILMRLCLWREEKARVQNIPRQHLFKDNLLINLAEQQTTQPKLLPSLQNPYVQNKLEKYQNELKQCLIQGEDPQQQLSIQPNESLNKTQVKSVKKLTAYRNQKAQQLHIGNNLLLAKHTLKEIIKVHYGLSTKNYYQLITGWRAKVLLPDLIKQLV